MFFYFFKDVWDGTIGFERISGKHLSKNDLKTYTFVRYFPKQGKHKRTLRESGIVLSSTAPANQFEPNGIHQWIYRVYRIFRNQADQVSSAAARTGWWWGGVPGPGLY